MPFVMNYTNKTISIYGVRWHIAFPTFWILLCTHDEIYPRLIWNMHSAWHSLVHRDATKVMWPCLEQVTLHLATAVASCIISHQLYRTFCTLQILKYLIIRMDNRLYWTLLLIWFFGLKSFLPMHFCRNDFLSRRKRSFFSQNVQIFGENELQWSNQKRNDSPGSNVSW